MILISFWWNSSPVKIHKFIYLNCREWCESLNGHRSYAHNLSMLWKPENIQAWTGFEPMTSVIPRKSSTGSLHDPVTWCKITYAGPGGLARVVLFKKSHCATCSPACVILWPDRAKGLFLLLFAVRKDPLSQKSKLFSIIYTTVESAGTVSKLWSFKTEKNGRTC